MQTGHSSKWRGGWSKHTCSSKTLIRPRCNKRLFFFKTCRRYWTEGGSLRNVPVGGSSRKNNSSPSTTSSFTPLFATAAPPLMLCSPPPHSSRDLQPSVIIPQAPNPNACFAWFEGGYNVHGLPEGGPERLLVIPCESLKQAPGGADQVEGNGLVMKVDEKEEGHGRRKEGY